MNPLSLLARSAALAGALVAGSAQALPVVTLANIDFAGGSASLGYLGSQFTFFDRTRFFFDTDPISVTTTAGAAVTSLGAPFFTTPQPTTFFDPIRGSGTLVFDGGYQYSGFTDTRIGFSIAPFVIGLALTLQDGIHYGFARFDNTLLSSYGFESAPGVGIAVSNVAAIPEPETWALMAAGLGVLGAFARRRKAR